MDGVFDPYVTMSITSFGPATIPLNESRRFSVKNTNQVDDIDGAQSGSRYKHFLNKAPALQADVAGSSPKVLIRGRNVRDNSLFIDDIEGTRHTIKDRMMRTNRHVNPLEPVYPLPTSPIDEIPKSKFVRDTLRHDDIDGSTVKPQKSYAMRDTMSVNDIEGAQANWKPLHKSVRSSNEPHNIMGVQDISENKRYVDKTTRRTDPCNPQYYINGMAYADDKYAKPTAAKKFIADGFLLKTEDISGATNNGDVHISRREFRNTNYIQDIDGTQADSTKHSITTNRKTNPLTPVYQSLDYGEYLRPIVPPLLPAEVVKIPTISSKLRNVVTNIIEAPGGAVNSAPKYEFKLDLTKNEVTDQREQFSSDRRSGSGRNKFGTTGVTTERSAALQKRENMERAAEILSVRQLHM